ncbi:MAG TPA: NAD(P)-binding domain-containing protein [Polyangiaceae bacterium]|nr:NAD(P)-binding domain-containing protein [Polyangiaceae bacterium]
MATVNPMMPVDTLVEEGNAFEAISEKNPAPRDRERLDVVVIGGGQAGLSVGYHLMKRALGFVILDGSARIGDTWRKRWDSLHLFTPAWLDSLDGLPFPAPPDSFPTKDEMGDYLELYASHFRLPVRSGVRVESVSREGDRYIVRTQHREYDAAHVVVAMANYQRPRVPAFAKELSADIVQIHSSDYKNPTALREGAVLVAGAGNSGAEIAKELARRGHAVLMSGRDTGQVPFRIDGFWARLVLWRVLLRLVFHRIMTVRTPMGRKMRSKVLGRGGPLIRVKNTDLLALGVERLPRVAGVRDGRPVLDDGRMLDVTNVVWCTGFERGFDFVRLPIFEESGEPRHESGVVTGEPGLYFVGLHFLHAMSSTMIHGVGRDAARIAGVVAQRCEHAATFAVVGARALAV